MLLEVIAGFLLSTCGPNYSPTCLPTSQDLFPVLVILALILAAAGLTRGADIFAMFGVSTLLGTSGRLGGGGAGKGFGASKIRVAARGQSRGRFDKVARRLMRGNKRDPKSKGGLPGRYRLWKQARKSNLVSKVNTALSKPGPPSSAPRAPPSAPPIVKTKTYLAGSLGALGPLNKSRVKLLLWRLNKAEERETRINKNFTTYIRQLNAAWASGASHRHIAGLRAKLWFADHQLNKKGGLRFITVPLLPPIPAWKPRGAAQKAEDLRTAAYKQAYRQLKKSGALGATTSASTPTPPPPPPPKMKTPTPPPPPPPPPGFSTGAGTGTGTGAPSRGGPTPMPFFIGIPFMSGQGNASRGIAASQRASGGSTPFGSKIVGLVLGSGQGTYNRPYAAPSGKENPYRPWYERDPNGNVLMETGENGQQRPATVGPYNSLDNATKTRLEYAARMAEATGNISIAHVSWDNVLKAQANSLERQAKQPGVGGQRAEEYKTALEDYAENDKKMRDAEARVARIEREYARSGRQPNAEEQKVLDSAKANLAEMQNVLADTKNELQTKSEAFYGGHAQRQQSATRTVTANADQAYNTPPPPPPPPPPSPPSPPPPPSSQTPPGPGSAQPKSQPQVPVQPQIQVEDNGLQQPSAGGYRKKKKEVEIPEDRSINEAEVQRELQKKAAEAESAKLAAAQREKEEETKEGEKQQTKSPAKKKKKPEVDSEG